MMEKQYNAKESEEKWMEFWEKENIYKFDANSKSEIYSIDTPPPTVSGKMHLGHSFSYSQQDFIARFQRMSGKNVFYPFGTDANGLATERMIEKMKNVKGQFMKRSDFVELCLKTLEEIRADFVYDWKRIGISADFNIFYTTIDRHSQKISQKSFLQLYKMGRIYKKKAPFIWCPECQTAIAQVEMKDSERQSNLVYMKFDTTLNEQITIATTRPELLPSCVAIHINPDDKRYKKFIGAKAIIPFLNREVKITANKDVDMEFGSGIVYHCTFGDMDDVRWMEEYNIEPIEILNKNGTLNEKAGRFKGLYVKEARKAVIKALEEEKRIAKTESIKHVVNVHERCDTDIEILTTEQWFIKYLDLKDDFIKFGRKIKWYPEHMRIRYENWIHGLKWDCNISRQRHFGIPIPLWYCKKCSEIILAEEKQLPVDPLTDKPLSNCKCSSNEFIAEKDVLDTWATSSLTPDIAIELFNDKEQKKLFPMSLRPQAHDIITFWLFNTVVKSYFHHKNIPWKEVMISGWALDPHGKKMSKSKGNVIEPREMISKYSADALRFWAAGSRLGDDLPFQEKDLVTGQKFTTKIWNASKFAFMHLSDYNKDDKENKKEKQKEKPKKIELMDRWILSKISRLAKECTENLMNYEYSHTKLATETFFWHTFCDNYLEIIKDRLYNSEKRGISPKISAQYGLYHSLLTIIKLMAPITPFITEELYQLYYKKHEKIKSIHIADWPSISLIDENAEKVGDFFVHILQQVRKVKSESNMSLKKPIKKITAKGRIPKENFEEIKEDLIATTNAEEIVFEQLDEKSDKEYDAIVEM
ncbi:valine--tRNA ligase [Candidatus Woesearchaeota archaeon]|nr:valine--tRNA ligase [Candidatus Woesearchaeota archaeon]